MSGSNTILLELRRRKVIVGLKSLLGPSSLRTGLYFAPKLTMKVAAPSGKIFFLPLPYFFLLILLLLLFSLSLSFASHSLGQFCLISQVFTEFWACTITG